MAFYFRKFRQSLRLVPATKSLGYSTWLNEGDCIKEGDHSRSRLQRSFVESNACQKDQPELCLLPPSSALVPLSERDMALVLLPRLEENNKSRRDDLKVLSSVAKTASFTCDDILVDVSDPFADHAKSTTIERIVVRVPFSPGHSYSSTEPVINTKAELKTLSPLFPLHGQVEDNSFFNNDQCLGQGVTFDPAVHITNSNRQLPVFNTVLFSSGPEKKGKSGKNVPTPEQLYSVKERLETTLVGMFSSRYDYTLLHKDILLENNLFGNNTVCRGQISYALELLKLRLKIHAKFSSTTMEVLNTTVQEENGVIRIHWRLKGLPQTEVLKFWRIFQRRDEVVKDDWQWFEAFSYFHVGKDGLVYKHRIDRMLPGNDEPDKLSVKLRKLLNPAKPLVS